MINALEAAQQKKAITSTTKGAAVSQAEAGEDNVEVPYAGTWLFESGVAVLGADGETDVRPSPVEQVTLPIQVVALTMAGVPLLDNLDLDELGRICLAQGRYTFALVISALNIPQGTGSPVNPTAIL